MYWSSYQNISQFNLFEYQLPIGDLLTGSVPFRKVPIAVMRKVPMADLVRQGINHSYVCLFLSSHRVRTVSSSTKEVQLCLY